MGIAQVGRLAPSPTGALHVGNIRTFLFAWLAARAHGGRIVLRIEDLEKPGSPQIMDQMISDLQWLGFDWDEGPYIQSERSAYYQAVFEYLRSQGSIYPCVCSRADYAMQAPHEGELEPRYPGTCRDRFASPEEARLWLENNHAHLNEPVWRFRVPTGLVQFVDGIFGAQSIDVQETVGDFVVFKTPTHPSYQLAVVADDIAMGVTLVVRGADLVPSTARQILLYAALGEVPGTANPELVTAQEFLRHHSLPEWAHIPLVLGPDGKRIAKRHGDSRIHSLRDQGVPPGHIIATLARWSGLEVDGPALPGDLLQKYKGFPTDRKAFILDKMRLHELEQF